jgi:hypothetical protein
MMMACVPRCRHSGRGRRSMENTEKAYWVKLCMHDCVLPVEQAPDESHAVSVPWRKVPVLPTIGRAALLHPKGVPTRSACTKGIKTSVSDPMDTAGAI